MLEKQVENALKTAVKNIHGTAYKFISPGTNGMPDRLIILPGGRIAFAELKAPGKKPTPLQKLRHQQLANLGVHTYIIDHPSQIQGVLDEIQATPLPNPSHPLHPNP